MNTQNEIQTLRKEIDDLRNENIALYNELTKQNKILCEQLLTLQTKNDALENLIGKQQATFEQALADIASIKNSTSRTVENYLDYYLDYYWGMQAAEFVGENLFEVKSFKNRAEDGFCASEEYLKYVLSQTENFPGGLFLEFGVFYGRSITFTARAKPDKIIYGFDSFEGLPEKFGDLPKGQFTMHGNMPRIPFNNVKLIKGWFDETLPEFLKTHPQKCEFIHVDCDCYSSTKTIFDNLKNQIGAGTVIAFDEYFNMPGWKKYEYKAFMEYVEENNIEFEYIARTNTQQVAVKIK